MPLIQKRTDRHAESLKQLTIDESTYIMAFVICQFLILMAWIKSSYAHRIWTQTNIWSGERDQKRICHGFFDYRSISIKRGKNVAFSNVSIGKYDNKHKNA